MQNSNFYPWNLSLMRLRGKYLNFTFFVEGLKERPHLIFHTGVLPSSVSQATYECIKARKLFTFLMNITRIARWAKQTLIKHNVHISSGNNINCLLPT